MHHKLLIVIEMIKNAVQSICYSTISDMRCLLRLCMKFKLYVRYSVSTMAMSLGDIRDTIGWGNAAADKQCGTSL